MELIDCSASMVIYQNPESMVRRAAESYLHTEISRTMYVIDNSPTTELQATFAGLQVTYHKMSENVGYGRGHNWAINGRALGRYHLILNPDVLISEGTLERLVEFLDKNPEVGMVCPKVLNPDGTVQHLNKRTPTVLDLFLRRIVRSGAPVRVIRSRMDRYEMKDFGYDSIYDVPFVTGAFMLCRSNVLKSIGGFDPRYFMYFEDADLSRQFQLAGYRTTYFPNVSVVHEWERASHKSFKMALVLAVNGFRFFNKWGWKFF